MKNNLEKFLKQNTRDGGFLQSEHWAEFKRTLKEKVFEFGEEEKFRALAVEHQLPLIGKYWMIPRGPIMRRNFKLKTKNYLIELIKKARENNNNWIRIEPQKKSDKELIENLINSYDRSWSIIKAKKNHQPAQTLMIDLTKSEEDILMDMKSKTRYNIRLSRRKGVEVFKSNNQEDIEKFSDLLEETAKRDGIVNHPRAHYQKMLKLNKTVVRLYLAKYQGEVLAGAIISFYGGVATYLHGASSSEKRNLMAPFGLHWQIIKQAKKENCKRYDLGGTKVEQNEKGENIAKEGSWQGISRFKSGFCPQCLPVEFPGCWDIVLNKKKYWLYRFLQKVKDIKNRAK